VFAIAITLLVLEIAIPASAGQHLLRSFIDEWPSYLAYIVSFSSIGAMWLGHNAVTEYLEHVDATFVRLNLLFLLFVSFLPFPTKLFGEFIHLESAERVAVTIYGVSLLLTATLLAVLWRYARRARLVRPDASDEEIRLLTQRLTPGLAGYLILIVVGLFVPVAAVFGYFAIAIFYIIPFREVRPALLFWRQARRPPRS